MPPEAPSQSRADTVPVTVGIVDCGTRTTWKRRWPWVPVAVAVLV